MNIDLLRELPGGPDLIAWFDGRVPSFHDAEVVEVVLDRSSSQCRLKIHAFETTPDVNAEGYYICKKHVVISFQLEHVSKLELTDFNHQNVIDGLNLTRLSDGRVLFELEPCYGLFGQVSGSIVQISLEPGIPSNSVHLARNAASHS